MWSVVIVRIGYAAFQLCGGGCVLKEEVATPSSVVLVQRIFVLYFAAGGQTIFNCVHKKLDHRLQHTSCTMGMTFGKFLAAMPCEYQDRFLEYNLLEQHISLHLKRACQCSVKREIEEACSPFGSLQAAAVLCSLRGLPARYTGPCSYCSLPELHEGNQLPFQKEMSDDDDLHGGAVHDPAQGGPKELDLKLQISRFESLLRKELSKINKFFNRLHLQYIARMKVCS
jgi:hypothetical protein